MKDKPAGLWTKEFIIVMLACSGISFCNYFFSSTLPIYAQNMTGTTVYAGLIMTAYTFAALATRPLTGLLSDRYGRVKLLIIGAGLCAGACLLYQFAAGIALLIFVRILHGIGFGIHSTSGGAVAADVIPKSRMSEGLGIFGLYGTIASALAPGIALTIIGDGASKNFRTLFILAAVIAVICMVLDSRIRYEKRKSDGAENKAAVGTVNVTCEDVTLPKTYLGFERGAFLPAAVIILVFIAFSSMTSFLTLFARERALGNIGLYFTINAAGMFVSRALLGKVADRRGADTVVIPALGVLFVCFAAVPFINSPVWLFILALPLGLAQGAVCPAINTMIFQRCSPKRRGTAAAAYFSSIDLGIGIGSFLFGLIADNLGFDIVYWTAALCVLAAAAIYLLRLSDKKTKNQLHIIKT